MKPFTSDIPDPANRPYAVPDIASRCRTAIDHRSGKLDERGWWKGSGEVTEPDRGASSERVGEGERAVAAETFAVRLERLIGLKKHDDGRPYTKPEIAEEMSRRGLKVSKSHLYGLLNGTSKPSLEVAQDFAEYFEVELEYFGNSKRGREIQAHYDLLAKFSTRGVLDIAFLASALPPDKLSSVLDYIEFQPSRQARDEQEDDRPTG